MTEAAARPAASLATLPWTALTLVVVLRAVVAFIGIGTNDVLLWQQFGRGAWSDSFLDLWRVDPWLNHPPLPVLYAALCYAIAGENTYGFSLLIKMPAIVGDLISTVLIARIVAERGASQNAGRAAALLFAISPASILLSGYHGNLDSFMATFSLMTWRLAERGRLGRAGLAAGMAINVKLAAAPAAVLLLACCRTWPQFRRVVVGLMIASVPFAVMIVVAGRPFLEQTLGYRPPGMSWLMAGPWALRANATIGPAAMWLTWSHTATLVQCTLLLILVLAMVWHREGGRRSDLLTLAALFWSALVFWAGGSFQYAAWPLPLLAALRPRIGFAYGVGTGVWLALAYADACVAWWPFQSLFFVTTPARTQVLTAIPLVTLLIAIVSLARRSPRDGAVKRLGSDA